MSSKIKVQNVRDYLVKIAGRKDPVDWESDDDPVADDVPAMEAYEQGFSTGVEHGEICLAAKILQRFFEE